MEFLDYFKLGPLTQNDLYFLIWLFGAVGGYCFGRAHAAWISINNLCKSVDATVKRLNKGTK